MSQAILPLKEFMAERAGSREGATALLKDGIAVMRARICYAYFTTREG